MPGAEESIHGEQAAHRQAISELIFFASVNDVARCQKLIKLWNINVCNPNCRDSSGRTPMHVAAASGSFSVVKWLLDMGADINARDRAGRTPLEDAVRADFAEIAQLLQGAGGKVWEKPTGLCELEDSKIAGLVNVRPQVMHEFGLEMEWEVHPDELEFKEQLGEGEFGVVHRGVWHGTPVAIKVLKRSDEVALGDFRTELSVLRKVHHPNAVQFLGAVTRAQPYMVITEYMACSLADAFKATCAMPARRQVEIALDCARGMAYMHARTPVLIHRDLKPANLLVGGNPYANRNRLLYDTGVVKIADFGLCKALPRAVAPPMNRVGDGADTPRKATDSSVYRLTGETGSYRYMAPEVFKHEPYNSSVDVYAFSMIAFQLFEGELPFNKLRPEDACRQVQAGMRPAFPAVRLLDKPRKAMRDLIVACWAEVPDDRPSFEQIVESLDSLLQLMPPRTMYMEGGERACGCSVQ